MDIYVQKDGQKLGPFSETKVRQGIDTGQFSSDDLAWSEGKASWQPLSVLINLDVTKPPPVQSQGPSTAFSPSSGDAPSPKPQVEYSKMPIPAISGATVLSEELQSDDVVRKHFWHKEVLGKQHDQSLVAFGAVLLLMAVVGGAILIVYLTCAGNDSKRGSASRSNKNSFKFDGENNKFHVHEPTNRDVLPSLDKPFDINSYSSDQNRPNSDASSQARAAESKAGLRSNENAFITTYGKSPVALPGTHPPASDDMIFGDGHLNYLVSFWNGKAHRIEVFRKDRERLADDDVKNALATYSDGVEWIHQDRADVNGREVWERDGAVAWLVDYRSKDKNPTTSLPINILYIFTNEFFTAEFGTVKDTN